MPREKITLFAGGLTLPKATLNAICEACGYEADVLVENPETDERVRQPNPISREAFVEKAIRRYFNEQMARHLLQQDKRGAQARIQDEMDTIRL